MKVHVHFYSYFRDLTGCVDVEQEITAGTTLAELAASLQQRFPKLAPMARSTLIAVGVDYQDGSYVLQSGDEVSLFPPVQGG